MDKGMALWGQASDSFIYSRSPNRPCDFYTAVYGVTYKTPVMLGLLW